MSLRRDETPTSYGLPVGRKTGAGRAYSLAFRDTRQANDEEYAWLRERVIEHIREVSSEEFVERVDLSKTQIRRVVFEDGVLSYDATHPRVTHESVMDCELPVEEVIWE